MVVGTAAAGADGHDPDTGKMPPPPKAKVEPVTETIHGKTIVDPYRWMEDAKSPETQKYVADEMAYTRSLLDPLPGRDKIHARLAELLAIGTLGTPQVGGEWIFYTRRDAGQNQPVLYVRKGMRGQDRPLVDVNQMSKDALVALDWWYASHDGKYVAYGTSPNGSEESTLHVIETATGKELPEAIERTRFSSVSWLKDNSGFYYTRHPKKGEVAPGEEVYYSKVFFHDLGSDPAKDPLIFGEGRNPQDVPAVSLSDDDRWLLITVFQGWAKSEMYIKDRKSDAPPVPVAEGKTFLYEGTVYKGKLYIHTNEDAPRYRVYVVDAVKPQRENWKELIPQGDAVLTDTHVFGGRIVAQYEENAHSLLKVFPLAGGQAVDIPMPTIGSITGIGGKFDHSDAFFGFHSYTVPPSVYHVDLQPVPAKDSGKATLWGKVEAQVDPSKYEVEQVWFTSKDGTKVPMFLVHQKGLSKTGHAPTLLSGYGGFNISRTPVFNRGVYLFLERGGIYADAQLRGGSEFGEDWHRAGMLGNKQNVFDDFIAAAEYLIQEKYTDKDHLAISGGSNGGLLVGAALTQRPDLYKAVVCAVPLLDMLRYQNFQIAKLWIAEYGSSDDPKQFEWLYAYSPYHHVKEGTKYPAVLFMTADTDTRVDPMHAKKMAARLQAANGGNRPILLRIETKAGHGQGKPVSKQVEESTDVYSFLFWQLGVQP
ncbi:MAG: prolyl oligopeptidase family serine peptidase [Acidobacteriia bacterium]|nr:prolyl oligopeptidase family serine peptidase [Terriglobia bacterium]